MANTRGKARKVNEPYEVWSGPLDRFGGVREVFQVLKCYQTPEGEAKNAYARRLVAYGGTGEVDEAGHDMYLADLRRRAILVWQEGNEKLNGKDTVMPQQYKIERGGRWSY
jgi:hypothetical protein